MNFLSEIYYKKYIIIKNNFDYFIYNKHKIVNLFYYRISNIIIQKNKYINIKIFYLNLFENIYQ